MIVKLLTEHHLEFLSLKGGGRGSSESTLIKMSNCWKSHAAGQMQTVKVKCREDFLSSWVEQFKQAEKIMIEKPG